MSDCVTLLLCFVLDFANPKFLQHKHLNGGLQTLTNQTTN